MAQAPGAAALAPHGRRCRFQAFIRDFETTAVAAGITPDTYNKAMAGHRAGRHPPAGDRQPAGIRRQIWSYLDAAVSARRVADAKAMLTRYAGVLSGIETKTGVPKEILVAIWGMETDYGSSDRRL